MITKCFNMEDFCSVKRDSETASSNKLGYFFVFTLWIAYFEIITGLSHYPMLSNTPRSKNDLNK